MKKPRKKSDVKEVYWIALREIYSDCIGWQLKRGLWELYAVNQLIGNLKGTTSNALKKKN
jgi:hypothetical protein